MVRGEKFGDFEESKNFEKFVQSWESQQSEQLIVRSGVTISICLQNDKIKRDSIAYCRECSLRRTDINPKPKRKIINKNAFPACYEANSCVIISTEEVDDNIDSKKDIESILDDFECRISVIDKTDVERGDDRD